VADDSLPRPGLDAARPLAPGEDSRDLGFGGRVAQQTRSRFLNRDGSFNVRREGLPFFRSLSAYHALLTMSWPRFFLLSALGYFAANAAFAVAFPLHWVVVHPIDEQSPLHGITAEEFLAADSEVLILLSAMDETFFQTVHVRSSYKPQEIAWGMKFADMFLRTDDGLVGIDMRKIHDLEPAP